jgi:hypothetical protein
MASGNSRLICDFCFLAASTNDDATCEQVASVQSLALSWATMAVSASS